MRAHAKRSRMKKRVSQYQKANTTVTNIWFAKGPGNWGHGSREKQLQSLTYAGGAFSR